MSDKDECRKAFENYARPTYGICRHHALPDQYAATGVQCAWMAWQHLWNAREKDAEDDYDRGYSDGYDAGYNDGRDTN